MNQDLIRRSLLPWGAANYNSLEKHPSNRHGKITQHGHRTLYDPWASSMQKEYTTKGKWLSRRNSTWNWWYSFSHKKEPNREIERERSWLHNITSWGRGKLGRRQMRIQRHGRKDLRGIHHLNLPISYSSTEMKPKHKREAKITLT